MTTATEFLKSTGLTFLDTAMCGTLALTTWQRSMSSRVGSHVRTLATWDNALALQESDRGYGLSLPESLANYDPATLSWRTSQTSLFGGWAEFLGTWPQSGMTRSGQLFQRAPWVRHTHVKGCSLWRTPVASDGRKTGGQPSHNSVLKRVRDRQTITLAMQVMLIEPGPLNPQFVESLMGFPIDWTALED